MALLVLCGIGLLDIAFARKTLLVFVQVQSNS